MRTTILGIAAIIAAGFFLPTVTFDAAKAGQITSAQQPLTAINCHNQNGNKVCLCRGKKSCDKLAANCAVKLTGEGKYKKCNDVLSRKPMGLSN